MAVTIDKVMTRAEVVAVLDDLKRRAKSKRFGRNARLNLVIFRLATCCGLRVSELTQITLNNVRLESEQPKIVVPKHVGKGKKARKVPVIDRDTLDCLRDWKKFRASQGAQAHDCLVCTLDGAPLSRFTTRHRFKRSCKVLGRERQEELTIHHGRHSFISHALHQGYSVVQVQNWAGHSSLSTTSIYAHLVSNQTLIGDLFG